MSERPEVGTMGKEHAENLLAKAKEVFPVVLMDYAEVIIYLREIGDLSDGEISDWLNANGVTMGQNRIFQVIMDAKRASFNLEIQEAKDLADKVLESRETNFGGLSAEELMKG